MSLTIKEAKEEITHLVLKHWKDSDTTKYIPLHWEGTPMDVPTDGKPFARVAIRHSTGEQVTIGGAGGSQKFRRDGTIHIQCFGPRSEGGKTAYQIAEVALEALETNATPGGIWFRNASPRDIGEDGSHYQVQVVATFTYDQRR